MTNIDNDFFMHSEWRRLPQVFARGTLASGNVTIRKISFQSNFCDFPCHWPYPFHELCYSFQASLCIFTWMNVWSQLNRRIMLIKYTHGDGVVKFSQVLSFRPIERHAHVERTHIRQSSLSVASLHVKSSGRNKITIPFESLPPLPLINS